jgi:hypothetical protein
MRTVSRWLLLLGLVPALFTLSAGCSKSDGPNRANDPGAPSADTVDAREILEQRERLDQTVWADEVEAQKYETVFIRLWDGIRAADDAGKFAELAAFPFKGEVSLGSPGAVAGQEAGVGLTTFQSEPSQTFNPAQWAEFVHSFESAGIRIIQTEWHHSRFVPASDSSAPKSTVSFSIHAERESTQTRFALKGDLEVQWAGAKTEGTAVDPVAASIAITGLTLQQRSGGGIFREILASTYDPGQFASAMPVLVYDLDGDGLSEIILPRWNRVYWNQGERQFERGEFLDQPIPLWEAGILSDFNGDGNADFVTVGKDGKPYFCAGTAQGRFPDKPVVCADAHFDLPTAITAGDADGDGDLDVWMTQYKLSMNEGQMPTPYYDAKDGYPSYYLENDGTGSFTDATERAGLSPLRERRTYSASFVDLDADGDLDLINVSDYAGLDIYENTGKGGFQLATETFVDERHFFGMGHTFGDYNQDGLLDFYVIGMSSTTARRLDRLNLGRDDRPDVQAMRAPMGYGNRLYLGTPGKRFREDPQVAAAVARTGWSWGVTSFDFDLDGDQDIYVANGHRSGKSCQDYCTTFWRHDIYTGDSVERPEVLKVFQTTARDLNLEKISWNGYEKNVLLMNQPARPGQFLSSAFMFGAAFEVDTRSVISDDLDADGRPDLVLSESQWTGTGFRSVLRVLVNEVETGLSNNWFAVRLRESSGPGFSPNGAKVAITDDLGRVQTRWIVSGDSFLAQHAPVARFGLGQAQRVKSIEVTWPNGKTERHDTGSAVNTAVTLRGGAPALSLR